MQSQIMQNAYQFFVKKIMHNSKGMVLQYSVNHIHDSHLRFFFFFFSFEIISSRNGLAYTTIWEKFFIACWTGPCQKSRFCTVCPRLRLAERLRQAPYSNRRDTFLLLIICIKKSFGYPFALSQFDGLGPLQNLFMARWERWIGWRSKEMKRKM